MKWQKKKVIVVTQIKIGVSNISMNLLTIAIRRKRNDTILHGRPALRPQEYN